MTAADFIAGARTVVDSDDLVVLREMLLGALAKIDALDEELKAETKRADGLEDRLEDAQSTFDEQMALTVEPLDYNDALECVAAMGRLGQFTRMDGAELDGMYRHVLEAAHERRASRYAEIVT